MSDRRAPRTSAEWVTFALAVAVIGVIVGLVAREIPGSKTPPSPSVEVDVAEERDGRFVVPVRVRNVGERTAEAVQVEATLTIDGEEQEADQMVDFLAGDEEEELEFVFDDDPDDGDLEVRVTGYTVP